MVNIGGGIERSNIIVDTLQIIQTFGHAITSTEAPIKRQMYIQDPETK